MPKVHVNELVLIFVRAVGSHGNHPVLGAPCEYVIATGLRKPATEKYCYPILCFQTNLSWLNVNNNQLLFTFMYKWLVYTSLKTCEIS